MPRVTHEELDPEVPFKRLHLLGEGRRRDVQSLSRSSEVELLGDGDEVQDLPEVQRRSRR
jgi:hypothetical protein